ncbi:MAG: hypothetical protein PWQ74_951 [Methanobacteriaceae archaeon]|nr:hypothetical protein [Methanobacteriaceae archaeon]
MNIGFLGGSWDVVNQSRAGGVDDCSYGIPSQTLSIRESAFDLITQIRNVNMAFDMGENFFSYNFNLLMR